MFTVIISTQFYSANRYGMLLYDKALWDIIGMSWCFLQFDICYKNSYITCISIAKLIAERMNAKCIVSGMIIICMKMKYSAHISVFGKILYVPQNNIFLRPKVTNNNIFISPKARSSYTELCVRYQLSQRYLHLFGRVPHRRF